MKRNSLFRYSFLGVAGLAVLFAGYSYWKGKGKNPQDKYLTVRIWIAVMCAVPSVRRVLCKPW